MATIADVARIAGVSQSTVSHVINGTRFVKPETEQAVRDAVARTGYTPNTLARALARYRATVSASPYQRYQIPILPISSVPWKANAPPAA